MKKEGIRVIFLKITLKIMAEEIEVESEEMEQRVGALPDEGTLEEIFEVVSGTAFDEDDEAHMQMMQQIIILLTQTLIFLKL